jgi:guanylate kinase
MTEHAQPRAPRESRRGLLIVISSPSGAGKTTLARRLREEFPAIGFSVSLTTRSPREGEVHGVDYSFVDRETFARMLADGGLAESAEVHGNWYGTSRAAVETALSEGRDMIFDIDWQGSRALAAQWPEDVVKVFVLPPSLAVLEARLRGRGTDDAQVIERRLRRAVEEMEHYPEYDHLVVNDDLEQAYQTLRAIYLVRRHGELDRPDVSHPLEALATRARASQARAMAERARTIMAGEPQSGR